MCNDSSKESRDPFKLLTSVYSLIRGRHYGGTAKRSTLPVYNGPIDNFRGDVRPGNYRADAGVSVRINYKISLPVNKFTMKNLTILMVLGFVLIAPPVNAQVPLATQIDILKAEDELRFDKTLESLLKSPNEQIRIRAALAAGRIGDERAVAALIELLEKDSSFDVRTMAAFALGEIESIEAAEAIISAASDMKARPEIRARAVEAAGKIAAANATDDRSKKLGAAIVEILIHEHAKRSGPYPELVRQGITAALPAKPEGGAGAGKPIPGFFEGENAADALNTLARLRAKNANDEARKLLAEHKDPIVRANAARVLGAAEDAEALPLLIEAATRDRDSRVRVSAIRSLAQLKDPRAADRLIKHGSELLQVYEKAKKPDFIPVEHSEFIEVAVALGQIIPNSFNDDAVKLFRAFGKLDRGHTPEVYIARVRIAPAPGEGEEPELNHWKQYRTLAQIVGEFAVLEPTDEKGKEMKVEAPGVLRPLALAFAEADPKDEAATILAGPDTLRAYARFKTDDLDDLLRTALKNKDVQMRTAAASLLGDRSATKENIESLKAAAEYAIFNDLDKNDAVLAAINAIFKLDKKASLPVIELAAGSTDLVVRRRVYEMLRDPEIKEFHSSPILKPLSRDHFLQVRPHSGKGGRLGQVLNTEADYRRAASRRNGSVRAVLTTQKGTFTIDLLPEDAPLTVDNFIKLANAKYFDGLEVHRVVPNFVMQDGDPRGDGTGGPGWSIRCEINMLPYERGVVGMALAGKDTGGSQWFVTHSPQPHLDGGYTVFGRVNETDMKVVDSIVRGDKILTVKITEARAR